MPSKQRNTSVANRLLAALPKKDYQNLLADLQPFALTFSDILFESGDNIRHVYFPTSGIVSLLSTVGEGEHVEVGIVGNEGMVGLPAFMGVSKSRTRALVQGEGNALRLNVAKLRRELSNGSALQKLLHRYTHSLMTQISQSAACNRFHQVNQRLARWLIMTHDRIEGDEFRLTQEFLSHMLGVRREGVTLAAGTLQKQNLIRYSRGQIKILDRAGLEAASCKCYEVVKDEYDNFLA
jgi:CRP-like cAMP-binding protein